MAATGAAMTDEKPSPMDWTKRGFAVVLVVLGLAGALDHTIAESLFGRRFDLVLPHLKYGHVMFNRNAHRVEVVEWQRPDGTRGPISELVPTPALFYSRARVEMNLVAKPPLLAEICLRSFRREHRALTFFVDDYDVDGDPRTPTRSLTLQCDAHGLLPR